MNARATGRTAAIVVLVAVLALIGLAWIFAPKPKHAPSDSADIRSQPPPDIPSPGNTTVIDPSKPGVNIEQLVQEGGRGQWTGRLSADGAPYRFEYEHLEPREQGVIELDQPVLWLADDERSIVFRAASARMRRPPGEREPSDGRLTGGIVADIYEGRVEDEASIDPDRRIARITLDSLEFERDRLIIRSEDDVRIAGTGIDALLRGLSVSLSEDESPLRLLRVARGGHVNITPDFFDRNNSAPKDASTSRASNTDAGLSDSPAARETFYQLVLNDAVQVDAASANIKSATLRALATLIDGKLPDDAIANFDRSLSESQDPTSVPGSEPAANEKPSITEPRRYAIAWDGPLELSPLEERPNELVHDKLFVSFLASEQSPARLTESTLDLDLAAQSIAYGATRRHIALDGNADPQGVTVILPESGDFVGTALEIDLTTGVGSAAGPHNIRAFGTSSQITSTGRADFLFDTSRGPIGSGAPVYPRSIIYTDGVEARSVDALLRGDSIRAAFTDASHDTPGSLASVAVRDNARAQDNRGSWIESGAIDILFAPDPDNDNRPTPFSARASGGLRAGSPEATLAAQQLEADIVPDDSGDPEIGRFTIREEVAVTLADGTTASGDLITGDARNQRIDLAGAPARIERADDTGTASLEADAFTLDGVARTLAVSGPGRALARSKDGNAESSTVEVAWDRSLLFDDAYGAGGQNGGGGRAEVAGTVDVSAEKHFVSDAGARGVRTHHANGDRVTLDLSATDSKTSARELIRALIEGTSQDEPGWSRVESRVYAIDADGSRRLLGVLFVTGPLMDASPTAQTVAVAGPGRLLIDNRADPTRNDADLVGADPDSLAAAQGTSLFEWNERLDLDAFAGSALMKGTVSFRHLNPTTNEVTDLRADELRASFDTATNSQSAALRDISALGTVVARHGSLQIVADAARYDALTGEILARGENGRRVTILDTATGRQDEAGAIRLNLETGAWSVTDPSAVLIPLR